MSNSHEMSDRQLITINTTLAVLKRPVLLAAATVFALVSCGLAATPFRSVRAPV